MVADLKADIRTHRVAVDMFLLLDQEGDLVVRIHRNHDRC